MNRQLAVRVLLLLLLSGGAGLAAAHAADAPQDARNDPTCILFQNVALDPPTTYSILLDTRDRTVSDVQIDAYTDDTTYGFHARPGWFDQGDPTAATKTRVSSPIELFDPSSKPFLFFTARAAGDKAQCQTYVLANDWDTKAWHPTSRVPEGAIVPNLTHDDGPPKCAEPFAHARRTGVVLPQYTQNDATAKGWRASVRVLVAADGTATNAEILKSDAPPYINDALLVAARASKYAPQLVRCTPIPGEFIFTMQG